MKSGQVKKILTVVFAFCILFCVVLTASCSGTTTDKPSSEGDGGTSTGDGGTSTGDGGTSTGDGDIGSEHIHDYVETVTEATCTEPSYYVYTCSCGDTYREQFSAPLGHDKVFHDGKSPTTSEPGWDYYYTCTRCDYTTYVEIPKLEYSIGLSYALNDAGDGYKVTGNDESDILVIVPATHEGLPVTEIGDGAFSDDSVVQEVSLPESIKSIGYDAFARCTSLKKINLPSQLTSIGYAAFRSCNSLQQIDLPVGITSIQAGTFSYCGSLTEIRLNEGTTSIEAGAFTNCSALNTVDLPDTLQTIGNYAFENCSALNTVDLPDTLQTIGNYAFRNCKALEDVAFPNGLQEIGKGAFYGCSSLTSLTLPDSLESVGSEAFVGSAITTLDIPFAGGNRTEGGELRWYYEVSLLESVIVRGGLVTSQAFIECAMSSVTLLEGPTEIGKKAFANCTNLTTLVIPDSVTAIGKGAFYNCTSLESLTVPFVGKSDELSTTDDNENKIGYMFKGVSDIASGDENNYVPQSLRTVTVTSASMIANRAFEICENIVTVNLPATVTSIDLEAFASCHALEEINIDEDNPKYVGRSGNVIIKDTKELFLLAEQAEILDDGSVLTIGDGTVSTNNGGLFCFFERTVVNVPESVEVIGEYAFSACSLTKVTLPSSLRTIEAYAFRSCRSLTELEIAEGVTSIGTQAFADCRALTELILPESVETIGEKAWANCGSLENLTVPFLGTTENASCRLSYLGSSPKNNLTIKRGTLAEYALADCFIKEIVLPENLTEIPISAFSGNSITTIDIPDTVETIDYNAFFNCGALTYIRLPDNDNLTVDVDAFGKNRDTGGTITLLVSNKNTKLSYNILRNWGKAIVYYYGTAAEWNEVKPSGLGCPSTVYYYSENALTGYWHYKADGITPVLW